MKFIDVCTFLATITAVETSEASNYRTSRILQDESKKDKIGITDILLNGTALSKIQCADRCLGSEDCLSFFHNKNTRTCQTHGVGLTVDDSSDLTEGSGFKYYRLTNRKAAAATTATTGEDETTEAATTTTTTEEDVTTEAATTTTTTEVDVTNGGSTQPDTWTATSTPFGYQGTVIFIHADTQGQDLFIRGGLGHSRHTGCTTTASSSQCAIPVRHRNGQGSHYDKVNAWIDGDDYLDWYGSEPGQGSFNGEQASGTPAVWTTSLSGEGHVDLNTFGDDYWMVDVDMDCSKTDSGWFELKAFVSGAWENEIQQGSCSGSIGGSAPFNSQNHIALCGVMNIFSHGGSECQIENLN